jgi:hypothetical protein
VPCAISLEKLQCDTGIHTIDGVGTALAETVARQPVFEARVPPNTVQVEGVLRVGHRFGLRLHPAVPNPDRPLKDGPLELFRLLMDLYRLHVLTPQVRGKEGLSGRVAIDEDRVVADRTS